MDVTDLNELLAEGREYVLVGGSFAPNGASAIVATSNRGKGFTVARTSAGLFTVTFTNDYMALVAAWATVGLAVAADMHAQIGTYTGPSGTTAATLTIRTIAVATETDIAADANNRVNFGCLFRKNTLTP